MKEKSMINIIRTKVYLIGRKIIRSLKNLLKPRQFIQREPQETRGRIIEYPFIFENISKLAQGKTLDVGCHEGFLITELAALGFESHGIDIRLYKVKYPNVAFIQGSICDAPYKEACFDAVIAVSTVEHIGISQAYGDLYDPEGDRKALKEMIRIVKLEGKILVTLPYGINGKKYKERRYKEDSLSQLISGLNVNVVKYFAFKDGYWIPVSQLEAEKSRAIVLLALSKA